MTFFKNPLPFRMRLIFFILLLLVVSTGYCQKMQCSFSINSINMPDSLNSCQLLDSITNIPFKQYNRKGKIPRFIKRTLNCWADGFNIANPGRRADIGCSRDLWIFLRPDRALLYLGLHKNYMLIVYKSGTIAVNSPVILFKFDKKKIISVWYWLGFMVEVRSTRDLIEHLGFYSGPLIKRPHF